MYTFTRWISSLTSAHVESTGRIIPLNSDFKAYKIIHSLKNTKVDSQSWVRRLWWRKISKWLTLTVCCTGRWLTLWYSTLRWPFLEIAGQSMMERRVCTQPTHCLWHLQGWDKDQETSEPGHISVYYSLNGNAAITSELQHYLTKIIYM